MQLKEFSLKQCCSAKMLDMAVGMALLGLVCIFIWYADCDMVFFAMVATGISALGIRGVRRMALSVGVLISDARINVPPNFKRPLLDTIARRKFVDQAWQLAIHVTCAVWEISLLTRNPGWWNDPVTCFDPCPADIVFGRELRFFYVFQLTLWIWTAFSCQWFEERRKDYMEMIIHHVATISLVLGSLLSNELAIGLVILVIHDISDILLDLMKMSNYLKLQDRHGWFISEVLFVANYVSWIYLRLYVLPTGPMMAITYGTYSIRCNPGGYAGSTPLSSMLLHLLLGLHLFWFYVLTRIAVRIIRGQPPDKVADEEYEKVDNE
jgi:hypothetical protein